MLLHSAAHDGNWVKRSWTDLNMIYINIYIIIWYTCFMYLYIYLCSTYVKLLSWNTFVHFFFFLRDFIFKKTLFEKLKKKKLFKVILHCRYLSGVAEWVLMPCAGLSLLTFFNNSYPNLGKLIQVHTILGQLIQVHTNICTNHGKLDRKVISSHKPQYVCG